MNPAARDYAVKASTVRGLRAVLEQEGKLHDVAGRLEPTARMLLLDPPPSSAWVDAVTLIEIFRAIESRDGLDGLHAVMRRALAQGPVQLVLPVVQGLLRLFGTSPATLFARTELLTGSLLRGVEFRYTATTPRAGVMEVAIPSERDLPAAVFVVYRASFELEFDMCGVAGAVSMPSMVNDGRGNRARYTVSW